MLVKKVIVLMFVFTSFFKVQAQDKIIKMNADTVFCKIKEVLHDEVKYVLHDMTEDVMFGIDKNEVEKLIFGNGKVMILEHFYGSDSYESQRKKAVKFEFFSPLSGNTTISYEKLIKPRRSWEVSLGMIGLGYDVCYENPRGAFAKFGIKIIEDSDFYLKRIRYAHVLKGLYFKPEIAISIYSFDSDDYWDYNDLFRETNNDLSRETNYVAALSLNVGKQWIINDRLLIDYYLGFGYGFGKVDDYYRGYHYGFSGVDNELPLAYTMGFKVGLLLE